MAARGLRGCFSFYNATQAGVALSPEAQAKTPPGHQRVALVVASWVTSSSRLVLFRLDGAGAAPDLLGPHWGSPLFLLG